MNKICAIFKEGKKRKALNALTYFQGIARGSKS
jgi:hypothetical protein